jgi:deazaflavin-dependent oxidoreductase (nitroreductase family)
MFPRRLAHVNRVFTNRLMRPIARLLPPLAVIEHRGRRTGRVYQTPVFAFRRDNEVVVVLSYGARSDWPLNLVAVAGGAVIRKGRRAMLDAVEIVPVADAGPLSPLGQFSCRFASQVMIGKVGREGRSARHAAPT